MSYAQTLYAAGAAGRRRAGTSDYDDNELKYIKTSVNFWQRHRGKILSAILIVSLVLGSIGYHLFTMTVRSWDIARLTKEVKTLHATFEERVAQIEAGAEKELATFKLHLAVEAEDHKKKLDAQQAESVRDLEAIKKRHATSRQKLSQMKAAATQRQRGNQSRYDNYYKTSDKANEYIKELKADVDYCETILKHEEARASGIPQNTGSPTIQTGAAVTGQPVPGNIGN